MALIPEKPSEDYLRSLGPDGRLAAEQAYHAKLSAWENDPASHQSLRAWEQQQSQAQAREAVARDKTNKARLSYNPLTYSRAPGAIGKPMKRGK